MCYINICLHNNVIEELELTIWLYVYIHIYIHIEVGRVAAT